MVRILTGRAHRLLAPVIAEIGALHAQDKPCVMLVPEQFTLQAERELMDRLELQGFFTIDVLSPSRLSHRVLASVGEDERAPLTSAGQRMAIGCALEKCEGNLTYYRASANRRGFPEKLAALLTDMKRGGLTPELLAEYARTAPENGEKLADLARIYAAYEAQLSGRFGDGEDRLRYVSERLPESGLLNGVSLYVYGFDALPEQLMTLLCAAAAICENVVVTLLCDAQSAPDGKLYRPAWDSVFRFRSMLVEHGCSMSIEPLPAEPLPAAPAIRHLDEQLFADRPKRFEGHQESVYLSQALNPYEEASVAARHILRLCAEGMEIERIAVLYPEQDGYPFAVAAALRDSGLPFYTDQKLPALSHDLARFLILSLRAMADGWRSDEMFALAKSGYAPLRFTEACALENYARAYGISRDRWTRPFTKGPQAELLEPVRARLMEPLQRCRAALVAARNTDASLAAVMALLHDVRAYDALRREEEELIAAGMDVRASQNSQIWQTLLELIDQLHALSGGARIPLKHIADRLECGFSAVSLAALPPASHMLHAGTLGHFLSGEMDAVFVLGLNDGVLSKQTDSLLTEDERARAQEATGTYLGLTDASRAVMAQLDVKRAMTLPRRLLFLSSAKTGPDGAALRPLSLLSALGERYFDGLPESPVPVGELPRSSAQTLSELSARLRACAEGGTLPPKWEELLRRLLQSPATAERATRLLRAAAYRPLSLPLDAADARRLYGDETLTVSRLEQFADCPYKHFVAYGLRPQIVKEWKVEPVDTGTFYHDGLHRFARLARGYAAYPRVSDEEAEALADAAITPMLDELMQGPMGDGARSHAQFENARRILRRAAVTLTHHLAAGKFELARTEASFGYPGGLPPIVLALADGREVMLRGRIDRIDRYEDGQSVYLRVIDYKSSRQDLDAAKTWWGLQLQLLLYLDAALAAEPGAKPAGAFYFYVADPLVESDSDLRAVAEDKLRELLQLRGFSLSDTEIIRAMDSGERPVALPTMLAKDGTLRKSAKALDLEQMRALLRHARGVAVELAEGLLHGETAARPAMSGSTIACERCDYRDVCGFEPERCEARMLPSMDVDELRARLNDPPA